MKKQGLQEQSIFTHKAILDHIEFTDNVASKYGIIYDENLHLRQTCYDRSEYHLNNCIFNNNIGRNLSCIAMIYNSFGNMAPELIVNNSEFKMNKAEEYGGTILIKSTHETDDTRKYYI